MNILKAARGRITGHFGDENVPGAHVSQHKGTDIGHGDMTPDDTRVIAPAAGRVVAAGWDGTYGNRIIIDHGNGWSSLLAHLERITVAVGAELTPGQTAGVMGGTGGDWPVHLHQELRRNGTPVDAEPYFTTLAALTPRPLPTPTVPEEEFSMIKFGHRKTHGDEWMIVHPDLKGATADERGYLVTTSKARSIAWGRIYANGSGDYDFDVSRDDYIEIQKAARDAYDAKTRAEKARV